MLDKTVHINRSSLCSCIVSDSLLKTSACTVLVPDGDLLVET
jgi:hypothetical protein